MRKVLLTVSIVFVVQFSLHAQTVQSNCDSSYRLYGKEHTTSKMFLTKNGGQLFAGRLEGNDSGAVAYLTKTNECGMLIWEKYYAINPGYRSWYARAFDESASGDVFALISADSAVGTSRNQMRLFKINAHGDQQWMSTYTNQGFDIVPYGICATADGGALAGGWKGFWSTYPNTALLVKFDANGSVEWKQSYGNGLISSIKQVPDGYVFIRYYWTQSRLHSYLYKINTNGDMQWHIETPPDYRYKYSDQYSDWAVQVMPKADNSGYTVVRTQGAGFYPDTIFLTKYDNSGTQLWNKKYAYQTYQEIHSIQNTTDNGYLLCGNYSQPVNDTLGVYLLRLDTNGDTVWTSKVTHSVFTFDYPLILTSGTDAYELANNKYVIGGGQQKNTQHGADVTVHFSSLLIKLPSSPQVKGKLQYTKLNMPGLLKISPNPATSFCIVELPELKNSHAQLELSDSYGRILQTISLLSAQKSVHVDTHRFNAGIYTVNILSGGIQVASSKLIVQ